MLASHLDIQHGTYFNPNFHQNKSNNWISGKQNDAFLNTMIHIRIETQSIFNIMHVYIMAILMTLSFLLLLPFLHII